MSLPGVSAVAPTEDQPGVPAIAEYPTSSPSLDVWEGKIFFSYARKDEESALELAENLGAAGVELWVDQTDIAPGANWHDKTEEALDPVFLGTRCTDAIIRYF